MRFFTAFRMTGERVRNDTTSSVILRLAEESFEQGFADEILHCVQNDRGRVQNDSPLICHSEAVAEESVEQGFADEILHCVQNDKGDGLE